MYVCIHIALKNFEADKQNRKGGHELTGDKTGKETIEYRKRRVKKIKRIIITLCIILLVLPTILSIFLMAKVSSLQRQINDIVAGTVTEPEEAGGQPDVVQASVKASATQSSVTASETAITSGSAVETTKKVYLTFDDGPGTQTAEILDILKKEKVKATFFVTGKEDSYSKKMYKRIVDEGHTLGMHSYSHIYDNIYKSEKAFSEDFNKLYNLLYDATGKYPEWYRFPGGSSTETMKASLGSLVHVLENKNVSYIDWNVISPEAMNPKVSKKKMIDGIMSDVSGYDTAVVMLYDAANRPMTVKSLSSLIRKMKQKNYELLPIDQDTAPVRHSQMN